MLFNESYSVFFLKLNTFSPNLLRSSSCWLLHRTFGCSPVRLRTPLWQRKQRTQIPQGASEARPEVWNVYTDLGPQEQDMTDGHWLHIADKLNELCGRVRVKGHLWRTSSLGNLGSDVDGSIPRCRLHQQISVGEWWISTVTSADNRSIDKLAGAK